MDERGYYEHSFQIENKHTMHYSLELLYSVLYWALIQFPTRKKRTETVATRDDDQEPVQHR